MNNDKSEFYITGMTAGKLPMNNQQMVGYQRRMKIQVNKLMTEKQMTRMDAAAQGNTNTFEPFARERRRATAHVEQYPNIGHSPSGDDATTPKDVIPMLLIKKQLREFGRGRLRMPFTDTLSANVEKFTTPVGQTQVTGQPEILVTEKKLSAEGI
ncbi:uncharacterized protein TEOVI_000891300 [Trypanosoma equiperdum]|uniref:Uncharacterized protein n=2 Tax=Trypanozoon TaxID=39700 RepID=Q57VK9_TRYB2|nr:hypothetical protein Tb927.7.6020 [Trypanosoma brucei brucei TREU927]AAX70360.1 hypothetical protein Tb927.7.6020 [Trypanosoma brucei]AAZ12666.1 hypothetical protein Tb927.7.6020 [Trypanosoma brucei brucei TREU927]SCU67722.1 hypothetical protein, conserved [Trypanosoma equiperdum]